MRAILPWLTLVLLTSASAAPALAQEPQEYNEYRGTAQEQSACIGDVFRLCGSHIPSVTNIVACLIEQKLNLSPACRVVFEKDRPPATRRAAQPRRALPQTEGSGTPRWTGERPRPSPPRS
jgi:hypothetical protein